MERCEEGEALSRQVRRLRFLLLGVVAVACLATGMALLLGYAWSGAWPQAPASVIAAIYLPAFFLLAWLLIPSQRRVAVMTLWFLSGVALAIWVYAWLMPDSFPVKVTALDILVLVTVPVSAYAYRRLKGTGAPTVLLGSGL